MAEGRTGATLPQPDQKGGEASGRRGFSLHVIQGPDAPLEKEILKKSCTIGRSRACDLVLGDEFVSAIHASIEVSGDKLLLSDHDTTNGVHVGQLRIRSAFVTSGVRFDIGNTTIEIRRLDKTWFRPPSDRQNFGDLIGRSLAMRTVFAELEDFAGTTFPILLVGETGTGKSLAARSIHDVSRRPGKFIEVNCAAIPDALLESELFGHVKGAFTDARKDRLGAFAAADGGTLFLDEIGDLSVAMQAKLLHAIEKKEVQPLGADYGSTRRFDVRVLTATHRELRAAVNAGKFREDLYYRISTVTIRMPPLRERPEDLDDVVREVLFRQGRSREEIAAFMTPELHATLTSAAWPGNIRELTNYILRRFTRGSAEPVAEMNAGSPGLRLELDPGETWENARERALRAVERHYLETVLRMHDWNITRAARHAGMRRENFSKKMSALGIRPVRKDR